MMRNETVGRIEMSVVALLSLLLCACASSKSQQESTPTPTAEPASTSSTSSADQGETKAIVKRVHFEEILGKPLHGGKPTGCAGSWKPLEKSPYKGKAYFCSKFNGPENWGEIPVTFTAQEGKLAMIAVQIFYDSTAEAKAEYEDFSGNLLDRCDRKTGFQKNIILDCNDYFVGVSWQSGYESTQLKVVYSLNFEDLPK